MLAYGISADCVDEYSKIGASTALDCMKNVCSAIIEVFREEHLRKPNQANVDRLLQVTETRDFPGMLGCIESGKTVQQDGRVRFKKDCIRFQLSSLK